MTRPPWAPAAHETPEEYHTFCQWLYGSRAGKASKAWTERAEAYDSSVSVFDELNTTMLTLCREQLRRHQNKTNTEPDYLISPRELATLSTAIRKLQDTAPERKAAGADLSNLSTDDLIALRSKLRGTSE